MNQNNDPWGNQGNDPWANQGGTDPNSGAPAGGADPWGNASNSSGGNNWNSTPTGTAPTAGGGNPDKVRTALILGIVGFVFGFIGLYLGIGLITAPAQLIFGIIAMAVGSPGLMLAAKNFRARKGMGIPALIFSILAVVFGVISFLSGIACTTIFCLGVVDAII